ncbi:MAG: hypothetical protein A3G02_02060 [Candidatus Yanofskybacteria bacterium RIFCSPLOWO2_12_FULL_44_13b]|nr:MAG: hypothetical protein A2657_01345 [Candidatus Yanofskybacteria bacterium RIFCSPHIGHO2_01_FULL_44_110b]OGN14669.1 MAG: hypothetical protein A3C01_03090 [Candidatus Yanofskybacteria bacterium RIFCSPHIGHO2_02_FULL_44_36b]OGN18738.1 MAG: hypothetical protein A3F50_02270 [Candidatus Yanofskybacteria bacterium RIFCSPHIGHO2_12_FULL_44_29b]OGN26083.1 MAG: hypothetical protein A3B12_01595 [Candidatus Yanofskybacteria bacterium RIFCSPLOWO2_01_FULL_44_88]OGN30744.1 MAG: hypothetical protein A3I96_0
MMAGAAFGLFIAIIAIWSLVWKGMALWKAARLGHKGWFVALLIINTAGILDILYIYVFSKKSSMPTASPSAPPAGPQI